MVRRVRLSADAIHTRYLVPMHEGVQKARELLLENKQLQVDNIMASIEKDLEILRHYFLTKCKLKMSNIYSRAKEETWKNGLYVFTFDENDEVDRNKRILKPQEMDGIDIASLSYKMEDFTTERPEANIETKLVTISDGNKVLWKNERISKRAVKVRLGIVKDGELQILQE